MVTLDNKNLELAIQLRHELHEHPELSNNEVWTKKHLIDFIKEHTKLEIVELLVYRLIRESCS